MPDLYAGGTEGDTGHLATCRLSDRGEKMGGYLGCRRVSRARRGIKSLG